MTRLFSVTVAAISTLVMQPIAIADPQVAPNTAGAGAVRSDAPIDTTKPYGWHLEPVLKAISATPDQRTKITAVVEEFRPAIEPAKKKYKDARDRFLQCMMTGKSAVEIMSVQSEMSTLRSTIMQQYTIMDLKIRKLLLPEQNEKYDEYRAKQGWTNRAAAK